MGTQGKKPGTKKTINTKDTKNIHEIIIPYKTDIFERSKTKSRLGPVNR